MLKTASIWNTMEEIPSPEPPKPPFWVEQECKSNAPGVKSIFPLQKVLLESSYEEMAACAEEPLRISTTDLVPLVSQCAAVLSDMAMELGVVLRLRLRGSGTLIRVDEVKIRRLVSTLLLNLLTISCPQAMVTISLESIKQKDLPRLSLTLSTNNTSVTTLTNLEKENYINTRPELLACRRIIERQGGRLETQWPNGGLLSLSLWFP